MFAKLRFRKQERAYSINAGRSPICNGNVAGGHIPSPWKQNQTSCYGGSAPRNTYIGGFLSYGGSPSHHRFQRQVMGIHDLDDDWGYAPDDEGYPIYAKAPGDEKSQQYLKVSAWGSALRDENHS